LSSNQKVFGPFFNDGGGTSKAELEPTIPKRFTGADLAVLLRSLPPVDEEFLRTVEELTRAQPVLPESP
jgi:hypothetical protein